MAKKKKNLTPEDEDRLRQGLEELKREVRELIEFLQAKRAAKNA